MPSAERTVVIVDQNGNYISNSNPLATSGGGGGGGGTSSSVFASQAGTWNVGITGTVAATQSGVWTVATSGTTTVAGTITANQGTPAVKSNAWPAILTDSVQNQAAITTAGALKVDGSAVTQTVSGTVTANAGTGTFAVDGPVATGSAYPSNPVPIGLSDSGGLIQPLLSLAAVDGVALPKYGVYSLGQFAFFDAALNGIRFQRAASDMADNLSGHTFAAFGQMIYNGTNFSRARTSGAAPTTDYKLAAAIGTGNMTSLSAAAATGAGSAFNLGVAHKDWSVQVTSTGSPASISVSFQISLDSGTTWTTIGSAITSAPSVTIFQNIPATMARLNLTTLSGGSSPTVTGIFCGY